MQIQWLCQAVVCGSRGRGHPDPLDILTPRQNFLAPPLFFGLLSCSILLKTSLLCPSGTSRTRGRRYRRTSTFSVSCSSSRKNCEAARWKWTTDRYSSKRLPWRSPRWTPAAKRAWTSNCPILPSRRECLRWRLFRSWISTSWVRCASVRLRRRPTSVDRRRRGPTARRRSPTAFRRPRRPVSLFGWVRSTLTVDWSDRWATRRAAPSSASPRTAAARRSAPWRDREASLYRRRPRRHRTFVLRRTRMLCGPRASVTTIRPVVKIVVESFRRRLRRNLHPRTPWISILLTLKSKLTHHGNSCIFLWQILGRGTQIPQGIMGNLVIRNVWA